MFRRNHHKSDLRQAFDAFLATMPPDAPIRAVIASDAIERELGEFDRADEIGEENGQVVAPQRSSQDVASSRIE